MLRFPFILALLFLFELNFSQTVATVSNDDLSADYFKERFEFTPIAGKHSSNVKNEFIYTLIAEKLWALEAVDKGFTNNEIINIITNSLTKMFARDAMYKSIILDSINISENELQTAVARSREQLELYFLSSSDVLEIQNLFNLLNMGVPFDSLLIERDEYKLQLEDQPLTFDKVHETLADTVYSLALKEFTKPIYFKEKWFIFFLKDKMTQVFVDEKFVEKTKNILIDRKAANRYDDFMLNFFGNKNISIKNDLFSKVGSSIQKILLDKQKYYDTLFIDLNDYQTLKNFFDEKELQSTLVKVDDTEISNFTFLSTLCFDSFSVDTLTEEKIKSKLGRTIKSFIEKEILAQYALRKGYDKSAEARHYIRMWQDYYLSGYYKNSLKDSIKVSDDEIKKYFNANLNNNQLLVKYSEILTDSLEVIDRVLELINKGMSFTELSKKYYKNKTMIINGGESNLENPNNLGELGKLLIAMNIGEVNGPTKTEAGYSLIKLLEKEYVNKKYTDDDFPQIKSKLKYDLMQKIYSEKIINKTVELANRHKVKIDFEKLDQIKVTQINTFLIKLLGFGGKINAVPIVTPFTNWVPLWLESKKDLP